MKTKIFITIIFLISLLSINFVDANTCSFLDSSGDCHTTLTELNDVRALASLKQINCAWSNCKLTLDVSGDGYITLTDVNLIKSLVNLKSVTINGAPSIINITTLNDTQIKLTVTDSDGTPRSDIGINFIVNEYPDYNGTIMTNQSGEYLMDIPLELQPLSFTAKFWFDADPRKQIPFTEAYFNHIIQQSQQSSSSGSGGGGSRKKCKTIWECTDWSKCMGNKVQGEQYRLCNDINECKTQTEEKPIENTSCYNWDVAKKIYNYEIKKICEEGNKEVKINEDELVKCHTNYICFNNNWVQQDVICDEKEIVSEKIPDRRTNFVIGVIAMIIISLAGLYYFTRKR